MVSFRLTPDEYDVLKQVGTEMGVTNVSALAKLGIQKLIADTDLKQGSDKLELQTVKSKVHILGLQMERLLQELSLQRAGKPTKRQSPPRTPSSNKQSGRAARP